MDQAPFRRRSSAATFSPSSSIRRARADPDPAGAAASGAPESEAEARDLTGSSQNVASSMATVESAASARLQPKADGRRARQHHGQLDGGQGAR